MPENGIFYPSASVLQSLHTSTHPSNFEYCSSSGIVNSMALFALLAMAGDMGGAFGPSVVGYFSQHAGDNLQAGLLTGCIFPLIMLATLIAMKKMTPEG